MEFGHLCLNIPIYIYITTEFFFVSSTHREYLPKSYDCCWDYGKKVNVSGIKQRGKAARKTKSRQII